MSDEYIKARDAAAEAFVEENESRWCECSWWLNDIMEETYAKAADWGRAYESPAVKAMRETLELIQVANVFEVNNVDTFEAIRSVLKQYQAEREGSGEK